MTDLIPIESVNATELFKGEGIKDLLAKIRAEVITVVPDLTTDKGRKAIASLARKVASSKVAIDDAGKALVAGIKAQAAEIDASRKLARDTLDALRDEVRKPLTDWEAEQARIAQEEADRARREFEEAEARRLAEIAERERLVAEREAKVAEELARQQREEQARIDAENQRIRDEQIAAEAKARAEADAAEQIARAKREADEAKQRAEQAAAQAEADRIAAAERARIEADAAAERARREAEERHRAEQARAEAVAKAEREAEERRAANKAHQRGINATALAALVAGGIPEELAKAVIILVATGKVPAVSINY